MIILSIEKGGVGFAQSAPLRRGRMGAPPKRGDQMTLPSSTGGEEGKLGIETLM